MHETRSHSTYLLIFLLLTVGTITVFLFNIGIGSSNISIYDIFKTFISHLPSEDEANIIVTRIRAPRACAALIGGSALAVAGLLLQNFFANPIVEPYILGISSGSSLFVALVILGGITLGMDYITPLLIFAAAFSGAFLITSIVVFAAGKVRSILTLLIIGIMCGYLCSAVTSILSSFAEREAVANFAMWTMGSFAGFTWQHLKIMSSIIAPMLLISACLAKSLNALSLGDRYAASMGINVKRTRYATILISSIITAAVTAFAGPISFIGLAVPHMCRSIFATSDCRVLIPGSVLGGAFISGLCDLTARAIASPHELPLTAVTSVIGAPVVVWLLSSKRHQL